MRRLKRFVRQIALVLAIVLLVPMMAPAAKVQAEEAEIINSYMVELGENAYLEYEAEIEAERDDILESPGLYY